jgi:hypothetical protein
MDLVGEEFQVSGNTKSKARPLPILLKVRATAKDKYQAPALLPAKDGFVYYPLHCTKITDKYYLNLNIKAVLKQSMQAQTMSPEQLGRKVMAERRERWQKANDKELEELIQAQIRQTENFIAVQKYGKKHNVKVIPQIPIEQLQRKLSGIRSMSPEQLRKKLLEESEGAFEKTSKVTDGGASATLKEKVFVGDWMGVAVDKPEEGNSRDDLTLHLFVSTDNGQFSGLAVGDFAEQGYKRVEKLRVDGEQLRFEVLHRTGVQMDVTLKLDDGSLAGEGVPVDSDEDRCDIILKRVEPSKMVYTSPVPLGLIGTWWFDNDKGDNEQMAIFPDGRVMVFYSNGHKDETRYKDGFVELVEYGQKAEMIYNVDGTLKQYFDDKSLEIMSKNWTRIDPTPQTKLLRPLTEKVTAKPVSRSVTPSVRLGVLPTRATAMPAQPVATWDSRPWKMVLAMEELRALQQEKMSLRKQIEEMQISLEETKERVGTEHKDFKGVEQQLQALVQQYELVCQRYEEAARRMSDLEHLMTDYQRVEKEIESLDRREEKLDGKILELRIVTKNETGTSERKRSENLLQLLFEEKEKLEQEILRKRNQLRAMRVRM